MPIPHQSILLSALKKSSFKVHKNGYSIIELLIVISIMAILFSVGTVNYRDFSRRKSLEFALNEVRTIIKLTKESALAGQKPSDSDCNSPEHLRGYILRISGSSATTYDILANCSGGQVTIKNNAPLPSGITARLDKGCGWGGASTNQVEFYSQGRGTNIPTTPSPRCIIITLTQTSTAATSTITIDPYGKIL